MLQRWRQEARARGELAFPGAGKQALSEEQQQIRQLQRQLREAEMYQKILRKPWPFSDRHPESLSLHRATPSVLSDSPNGSPVGSLAQWLLPVAPAATLAALSAETSPVAGDCPGLCTFRWQRRESADNG